MITTITGLPGNGKTLFALDYVRRFAKDRPVYYSGIAELKLPWIEFKDPERWMDCPDGSVIVIDESQRAYRPRMHGSTVPPHVAELETHRHRGLDIFLITQNPMLVEANVRRLCGQHFNVIRNFGMQRATVHEWMKIEDKPDTAGSKERGQRHEWAYPKDLFAMYKSAEVHTHKRRVPAKLWWFLLGPLFIGAGIWGLLKWWAMQSAAKPSVAVSKNAESAKGKSDGVSGDRPGGAVSTGAYLAGYVPRVPGLEYTAPVYDGITAPVRAPYPAACLTSKSKGCRCYSEQGTVLSTPKELCESIIAGGFYVAFDGRPVAPGGGAKGAERGPEPVRPQAVASVPAPASVGFEPAARSPRR